jgi:hypothetical protein
LPGIIEHIGWSAIGIWLRVDLSRQFNETPDCFGTGRKVDLAAAPVVHHPQKPLRDPHLKHAILRPFCGAARGAFATDHFMRFVLTKRTAEPT